MLSCNTADARMHMVIGDHSDRGIIQTATLVLVLFVIAGTPSEISFEKDNDDIESVDNDDSLNLSNTNSSTNETEERADLVSKIATTEPLKNQATSRKKQAEE